MQQFAPGIQRIQDRVAGASAYLDLRLLDFKDTLPRLEALSAESTGWESMKLFVRRIHSV